VRLLEKEKNRRKPPNKKKAKKTMKPYKIASGYYVSNCLMEVLKAKIRNSNVTIYFCKPRVTENGRFQMFHFMWDDGTADYDFSDDNRIEYFSPMLLFKGAVRQFELGFAEKYSRYRNKRNRRKYDFL